MRRTIRGGMTLVELLVVITIIGVLGGIVALVAPRFQESTRVGQGTSQFKNWLENARLRAQRDRAPRGLRLVETLPSSVNTPTIRADYFYKFVYVEQPDDITGQPSEIVPGTMTPIQLAQQRRAFQMSIIAQLPMTHPYRSQIDPATSPNGWKQLLWLKGRNLVGVVQSGDIVEFGGARYRLVNDPIPYPTPTNAADCVLILHRPRDEARLTPDGVRTAPLPAYRITRSMRPISGEPELLLPSNVAIDILWTDVANNKKSTRTIPAPDVVANSSPSSLFTEVVFSPSGEIIGSLGASGRLVFWLRDVSLDTASLTPAGQLPPGDNRLVVVHCRTGQVSTHPVDPTLGTTGTLSDPYSFVRDGKSSNLKDE